MQNAALDEFRFNDLINNLNATKCIPVEIIENHKNTGKRSK